MASCIPNHGTRCELVVSFMSQPLHPQRRSPMYPLGRKLGGPQSQSGHIEIRSLHKPLVG
jgi:hypothetical protein